MIIGTMATAMSALDRFGDSTIGDVICCDDDRTQPHQRDKSGHHAYIMQ